jgi:hypothetical protein
MLREFAALPANDLYHLARDNGIDEQLVKADRWVECLDGRGQEAVSHALFSIGWANTTKPDNEMLYLNNTGRTMLSLTEPPPRPQLPAELEVSDTSIRVGVGAPLATLLPFFRHCRISKLSEVCEFRVEKKALQQTSSTSAVAELKEVLQDFEPLPAAIGKLLVSQKPIGGALRYRFCSGIVKPADTAMVQAIRTHPRLKGYIEPGGPPGYLLIKAGSSFDNFLIRCRELGFELTLL